MKSGGLMKQQTKLVVNLDAFHHNIRRILGYKTGMFLFV